MNALQAKRFTLEGLDCASCAARIEAAIQRETGLGEVGINFSTRSILLPPAYAAKVQEIIDRIEPGVRLVDEATAGGRSAHGRDLAHGRDHAHVYDQPYGHRHGHAHPHDHIHDGDHRHDHSHGRSHAHEHKHEHDHDHVDRPASVRRIVEIAIAASLLVAGIAFSERLNRTPFSAGEFVVLLPAYWLAGRHVVTVALRNFRRGLLFDENSLMTIATVGAILIRELPEAVGVMLFYSVGEAFQDHAVDRSRRSIKALMDIRPDFANVRRNGTTQRVDPNTVDVGEEISVRPGERIPLDGDVIEGESYVDVSALTGESVPQRVAPGDAVLAGSVNLQGLLAVRVTRPFGESSVSKILDLVENAGARKARTEKFITRFSRYYTPAVAAAALGVAVIPPLLIEGAQFGEWVYRALVLLVISCPCALVLSIPLGYFGGIGGASRHGILVKGANFLDALTQVDTLAMDKTGTLTQGAFKVRKVAARSGFADDEVLRLAAHAERHSSHPIAAAIAEAYGGDVDESRIAGYEEIAGHGVKAFVGDRLVVAGNDRLLHSESIPHDECLAGETIVNVAVDGVLAGSIVIADEIKPDAAQALRSLKGLGIRRTVMLSGDDRQVAEQVARTLGIDEVYAELLPEEKVAVLEKIAQERHAAPGRKSAEQGKIAFAGDGINDAPVLARADVGIAMGGLGSDAAIEAADIVIMDDQPSKIGKAIAIARRTRAIVLQNIALALGVKAAVIFLGTLGMASMWEAVFADVGVSLIAVLNSARALRV